MEAEPLTPKELIRLAEVWARLNPEKSLYGPQEKPHRPYDYLIGETLTALGIPVNGKHHGVSREWVILHEHLYESDWS